MEKQKSVQILVDYLGSDLPSETDQYPLGSVFELSVLAWHHEMELSSIAFFDLEGNEPVGPKDLQIKELDRSYKDLYWWYQREEDYQRIVSFTVTQPTRVVATYTRSSKRVVLIIDTKALGKDIDLSASYLYCQEMTYNNSKCRFEDGPRFYFDLKDDMTFGLVVSTGTNVDMELDGATHHCTIRKRISAGWDLLVFGTLDEDDGYGDTIKGEGEHILLQNTESIVRFLPQDQKD